LDAKTRWGLPPGDIFWGVVGEVTSQNKAKDIGTLSIRDSETAGKRDEVLYALGTPQHRANLSQTRGSRRPQRSSAGVPAYPNHLKSGGCRVPGLWPCKTTRKQYYWGDSELKKEIPV
jgi:hypothetical protein